MVAGSFSTVLRKRPFGPITSPVTPTLTVDFVCLDFALVVEVDGAYHSEYIQIQKDEQRTEKLNAMGFQVLQFSNEEVLFETENTINS